MIGSECRETVGLGKLEVHHSVVMGQLGELIDRDPRGKGVKGIKTVPDPALPGLDQLLDLVQPAPSAPDHHRQESLRSQRSFLEEEEKVAIHLR